MQRQGQLRAATATLAVVASVVAGACPAWGFASGSGAGVPQPKLLRLTCYVGSAPQGVSTLGSMTLGVGHAVVRVDVAAVQMLNGSHTEGRAVLRYFDLFTPTLRLVGDRALLQTVIEARRRTALTLFGYVTAGARRLFVVQVHPG
ncbi:MAG: hypothetical protein ACE5I7_11935 [Candidatus Binatia bacterium]